MNLKDIFQCEPIFFQNTKTEPPVFRFTMPEERPFRPCEVDGKPAIFHRWIDEDKVLLQFDVHLDYDNLMAIRSLFDVEGCAPAGTSIEKVRHTFALVEYQDGKVDKVEPEKIKFTDRRVK